MERNVTIDYFRLFLSILVVIIHTYPLFTYGNLAGWFITNGLSRIAVPCFFILNGYFISTRIQDAKFVKQYLKRLIIMYIVWMLIYAPIIYIDIWNDSRLVRFFYPIVGTHHLWYVIALIEAVIILYVIKKQIKKDFVILILSMTLFFIGLGFRIYASLEALPLFVHRNFLFLGFPFVFIGYYIAQNKEQVKKLSSYFCFSLLAIGMCGLVAESYISFSYPKLFSTSDLFLSLLLLCPVVVVMILRNSKHKEDDGYVGQLASGIYFTHALVIVGIRSVFSSFIENYIYILPVVLFISMIMSVGLIELNKRIKIFL